MSWTRNREELRCWHCGNTVLIGCGVMTSCFGRECYHDACYEAHLRRPHPTPLGAVPSSGTPGRYERGEIAFATGD